MLGSCRLKTDLKGYRQVRMLNKHPALGSCSIYIFEPTKSRNPFANKQNKQTRFAKDFHTEKWPCFRPSARGGPEQDPEEKHVFIYLFCSILVAHVYINVK